MSTETAHVEPETTYATVEFERVYRRVLYVLRGGLVARDPDDAALRLRAAEIAMGLLAK